MVVFVYCAYFYIHTNVHEFGTSKCFYLFFLKKLTLLFSKDLLN